mgnify:CR=1 FL=1
MQIGEYIIEQGRCWYPYEGLRRYTVGVIERESSYSLPLVTFILDTEYQKDLLIKALESDIDLVILNELKTGIYNLKCDKFKNWLKRKNIEI